MSPFPTGTTYGAYYFSTIFCAILWGVTCIQMFSYFTYYAKDDRWLKIIVPVIFTMNTVQTALVVHGAYAYLVVYVEKNSFFDVDLPVSWVGFLLSAVVCVIVQGIFVVRAYRLSDTRSRVLPFLWVPLSLFELGAAIYCVVTSFRSESVTIYFSSPLKGVVVSYLAIAAFLDVAIVFSLTTSLLKLNRHIVTVSMSEMIRRLIIFSIFSGIWTALFSLLIMITYLCFPDTAIYLVFDLPLCSLYCNALLANLNSRNVGSTASKRELSTFRAATGPIILSTIVGLQDSQSDEERESSIEMRDWNSVIA